MSGLGGSSIATRPFAIPPFFAHTALYENASALSADTRGSQSRMETGMGAHGQQKAVSDLPRSEHRSSAMQRAASTSMQLLDSSRATAFDIQ